jgi:hypothetical protein
VKQKTFKREVAVIMLLWLAYIVETKDVEVINVLVWPIFSFAAASFGLDVYSKLHRNTPEPSNGRGAERSSQRPSRPNEQSDNWDDK